MRAQIELAKELELPIMIHTPHRDKKRGTTRTMDVLTEHGFDPARCVIDHNNEETVREVLDRGFFAGFSIYPHTKMGNERMTEIVRHYGPERIIVDSACDWGISDPLAVPKTAALMAERGIACGGHPQGDVRERACGLWPVRRHAGVGLARADRARPAHSVRGQQRAARRPDPAHRARPPLGERSADRLRCGVRNARRAMPSLRAEGENSMGSG